ncbi:MAG TPA: VanZ family protein [Actinomycetota bacterium]|nr:VanZ family protein [Actinomycetota bacterium]
MRQLREEYGSNLLLAALLVGVVLVIAAAIAIRRHDDREEAFAFIARMLAIAGAALVLAGSAIPGGRPFGRPFGRGPLVASPVGDALRAWTDELARFPRSMTSIILVGTLALFAAIGFLGTVGWGSPSKWRILIGCVVLSIYVELTQLSFVGGVASVDDVVLNGLAALAGVLLGAAAARALARWHA